MSPLQPGIVRDDRGRRLVISLGRPHVSGDQFGLLQLTVLRAMSVLALSLGFPVVGHGGILCFGQSAFCRARNVRAADSTG